MAYIDMSFLSYQAQFRHSYAPYSLEGLGKIEVADLDLVNETKNSVQVTDTSDGVVGLANRVELAWDRQIFGIPCARIDWYLKKNYELKMESVQSSIGVLVGKRAEHLRTRIDMHQIQLAWVLERAGFRFMGSNVELSLKSASIVDSKFAGQLACDAEIEDIARIAAESFRVNQYAADPQLRDGCRAMHAEWARNSVLGRADVVFVYRDSNKIGGFITCRIDEDGSGRKTGMIELLAVDSAFRGRGVGFELVKMSLSWFRQRTDFVEVGTQANNYAALAVYQKAGFKMVSHNLVYHRLMDD